MIDWSRLRRAQTAIYALAAFALIALVAWRAESLYVERGRIVTAAQTQILTVATGTSDFFDRTLDLAELTSDDVDTYIAHHGGVAAVPRGDLQDFLARKARQTLIRDFIIVFDAEGWPVAMSDHMDAQRINVSDREWFKALKISRQETYIGQAVRSRFGHGVVFIYARKILEDSGKQTGLIDVAIEAPPVQSLAQRRAGQARYAVWDTDGRLIVSNFMAFDARGNALAQRAPFLRAPAKGSGFLKTANPNAIVAYQRIGDRPMIATVTIDRTELLAPWHARVRDSLILLVLAVAAVGGLVWSANILLSRDARRRKDLEATAAALSAALAQRDTLLKEIHHRVKNNLQVTSSLIEMQASQFEDEAVRVAFKRTQQRLYAIGMIHDVLYGEQGVSIIDMRDYLTRLCKEVARANGTDERKIRMVVEISPISLPAERATSLGLCVSEVLVNAFKHAFPPEGGGEIAIRLTETDGWVELTIRDNGAGFTPESARSLGMRLIRAFATQLGGEFQFDSEDGTTFRLTFPAVREHAAAH